MCSEVGRGRGLALFGREEGVDAEVASLIGGGGGGGGGRRKREKRSRTSLSEKNLMCVNKRRGRGF